MTNTRYLRALAILHAFSLLSIAAYLVATTAYADAIPSALALLGMIVGLAMSCLLALWYLVAGLFSSN